MTTPAKRRVMLEAMDYLYAERARVGYAERRPMSTHTIWSMGQLKARVSGSGLTMDCSEAVTLICHVAGLKDPNGLGYNGSGYTGTLLAHLPHYTEPHTAQVGALVVFGPAPGEHVAMVHTPGSDPLLFSHGQPSDPRLIRLSDEAAGHEPPVTFLSIAHL